eukprot:Skav220231  [mRNA]  locus=scaffold2170:10583:10870:+ [translate_table: standard]
MLHIIATLPSGRSESFSLPESSTARELKSEVRKALRQKFLKLVTADGHLFADPEETLQAAGVQDGDHITAVSLQVKVAATERAFALWCPGGDYNS